MAGPADIFVNVEAHIASGRFIRATSTNKSDIRDFTFDSVDISQCRDVLDLGCAHGFFTRGLAGRLHPEAHLVGLDLWPQYEKYFLESCREAGIDGNFQLSGNERIKSFAAESFDLVLCSYALYFFPEAVSDIARILRPNGYFITVTHAVPHMQELVGIMKKLLGERLPRPVETLPLEDLFDAFSGSNGRELLAPWFGRIDKKEYRNSLRITIGDLPDLLNYLCFKGPKFVPAGSGLDEHFVRCEVTAFLRNLLETEGALEITKDDVVFVCRSPQQPG